MTEKQTHAPVDGQKFKKFVEAGLLWLKANQETVNNLNVFPVPDGDTGTNMVLTMTSAYNEIANSGEHNLGAVANAVAQGALMGARGNSGVILSQIWRGFARGLDGADRLDAEHLVRGFNCARDTAYKGVVRPVEGTILTVIKETAQAVEKAAEATQDLVALLEIAVEAADQAVQHTPELLPILKQAGVVDSGGKGLFFILEGILRLIRGDSLESADVIVQPIANMNLENTLEEVEEGQDFEVVVDFYPPEDFDLQDFYRHLEEMGTSIQVGEGDGMYRMHIHVPLEKRYDPIEYIMGFSTITKVAMENLMAQMDEIAQKAEEDYLELANVDPGQIAVVAVSPGRGLSRVFASLGAAAIVEGGQTMNPSTQELLAAFENLPTDRVIILPNNKNIILAAQQARDVTVKQVEVIPSRTVPQGLAAMMMHNADGELEEVAARMREALSMVITGEVTVATRTVEIDGVMVQSGQVIALLDGKLVLAANSLEEAVQSLLEKANVQDYELVTFYYGHDLKAAEANAVADQMRAAYPEQEFEVIEGGQPHYQFIISIE